ncbi:MAG: endopeptidase La [Pseudobdellovibrionaceae bacterium]
MPLPQGLLPILPLRNTVIFPTLSQVLKVGRERSVLALKKAEKNGFWIVAVQQKPKPHDLAKDQPVDPADLHSVGTLCRIDSMKGNPESGYQVVLRGMGRVILEDVELNNSNYLEGESTLLEDINDMNPATEEALLESVKTLAREILRLFPGNTEQLSELINSVDELPYLVSLCAGNIDVDLEKKQKILETRNLRERVLYLLQVMQEFKESLSVQAEIRSKLNQKFGQAQRQTILREQLKAIREELGEGEDSTIEEKLQKKMEDANMPEEVHKVAEREIRRLGEVGNQSPESHIIRNYLELLTDLPWQKSSEDKEINLDESRQILEKDHYGLEKVKKRIIQHLAVLKLKKENKGSILLFVGPPGVGKTSLGHSIASALGRKFVRVSLGGVRDDAEVRGHRRTYIGAMPGRIIQGLKRAGENNPVFLLDEVDKLSRAFNGDPAAALLEVLDPEQNANFLDHYLDVPFDLSKVFFIATANSLETIPAPLLDRMEIIDLTGYTTSEKVHIAKNHLIPKQLTEHGLSPERIAISDEALLRLITNYTREAGVRELQRRIAAVLRGSSERVLNAKELPVRVKTEDLEEILGSERFTHEITETINPSGVVTGLAWTPVGGDILFVEATAMAGKGKLMITGQLGEVMKESAQIAQSLIRTNLSQLNPRMDLSKMDLHVHVPSGAIPKDGPSAGVTILTALASLISGHRVSPKLAMTGEMTLRGAVLPVGGIKEKVIAAHRAGVEKIILPKKNERDLKEVPEDVRASLQFYFVDTASQLFEVALNMHLNPELFNQYQPDAYQSQGSTAQLHHT